MQKEWILIVEANLDIGVEANTKEEAMKKAKNLLEKIMIPNMEVNGKYLSVNLELNDVIPI